MHFYLVKWFTKATHVSSTQLTQYVYDEGERVSEHDPRHAEEADAVHGVERRVAAAPHRQQAAGV